MKVTEFFFGFGPRIWSTRRGEVEYGVKALPLGAYVRIIGMNDLEEVDPADEGRTYREKGYWARLRVVLAGPFMNFAIGVPRVDRAVHELRRGHQHGVDGGEAPGPHGGGCGRLRAR